MMATDNPIRERLRILAQLQPAGPRTITATRYGVSATTVYNGGNKPKVDTPPATRTKLTPEEAKAAKRAYARRYCHANKDKWDDYHRHRKASPRKGRRAGR